jgi:hypothetical protein
MKGCAGFPLTLELDASVERLSRRIGRAKPEEVELAIRGLNQIVAH